MRHSTPLLALAILAACQPSEGGPVGPGPEGPVVTVPFRIGSTRPEEGRAIAATPTGVVVATWFTGTLDFDPSIDGASGRTSFGGQDLAISKYDFDGSFQWVVSLGGAGAEVPNAIAATPDGGAVVVGYGSGGGTCGGSVLPGRGGRDILIAKVSAAGSCEWARLIGGTEDDEARTVAVDVDGSILVGGTFRASTDFDPQEGAALRVSRGGSDAFVARYAPDGAFVSVAVSGGTEDDAINGIAVGSDGEISVVGEFRGTATIGSDVAPAVLASVGGTDILLARYTALLGLRWVNRAGGTAEDRATGVTHDGNGDLLVVGTFEATADLDPGAGAALVVSQGAADVFLARYDAATGESDGFVRAFGGLRVEGVTGVTRHISGRIILSGWFEESVDFDPGPGGRTVIAKGTGGAGDGYVMAFASTGELAWVATFGGVVGGAGQLTIGFGVALDDQGTVWSTGRFYGRSDFDPGTEAVELQATAESDVFVSRYSVDIGALRVSRTGE